MKTGYFKCFVLFCVIGIVMTGLAIADGPPAKIEINQLQNLYQATSFDHKMHEETAESCMTCHHKKFGSPMACGDCHDQKINKARFKHESHYKHDSCASCHQTKSVKELACSSCHKVPFDKENLQVIGLKGALHAQCMGCHKKNGVADTCTSCHAKK